MPHKESGLGITLYPSPSAANLRPQKDGFYRTKCCGFPVDPKKVQSPGTANEGSGFVTTSGGDPTVARGGCPFCGSANNR